MNYDQEITDLVEAIKADKSIVQPWRNKASARLEEAQAFVKYGKGLSLMPAPYGMEPHTIADMRACTCPPGARDKTCAVHGGTK